MRVLVLGASGMLGNAMLRVLSQHNCWEVYGTLRAPNCALQQLAPRAQLLSGIHANQSDSLIAAFTQSRPQVVINCVGLVKQLAIANDPLEAIPINGLLPHRLASLCTLTNSRLVHISTDCVFSGKRGSYTESDVPDAQDLYGRSKLIGEVAYRHTVTLRTSIIGRELESDNNALVGWFLSQQKQVKGYTEAIFSGLPTYELARVVRDFVIPKQELQGLFHVAAKPISKYDLIKIINFESGKNIDIQADDCLKINRSLDGSYFRKSTGYVAPGWVDLVRGMLEFN